MKRSKRKSTQTNKRWTCCYIPAPVVATLGAVGGVRRMKCSNREEEIITIYIYIYRRSKIERKEVYTCDVRFTADAGSRNGKGEQDNKKQRDNIRNREWWQSI